jgi:LysR family transcriptional regulator, glycine cleavage system transcriptional activator
MTTRRPPEPGSDKRAAPALTRLPLAALRVFGAVAAHRSFSAAGEQLNLSTSGVSMQIRALEDYLQVPLFRRSSHFVELTAEGERLRPFVERGLDELEQGFRMVRAERAGGVLVISLLASYLQRWLLPRLPQFHAAHPEIDLRLQTSTGLTDFARSEVHVAIRMGVGPWPRLHSQQLCREWLVPVCTPGLLAQHGTVERGSDTGAYPLLHGVSEPWSVWHDATDPKSAQRAEQWPMKGTAFDDSAAILSACEQGLGLALARWSLVVDSLANGTLVAASSQVAPYYFNSHFVCPPAYLEMSKVAAFHGWLLEAMSLVPQPAAFNLRT